MVATPPCDQPIIAKRFWSTALTIGSNDAALNEFKRAQQLDPMSLYATLTMGTAFYFSRQYDQAAKQYQRVLELDPNFPLAHRWLAKTYEQNKKYDEAIREFQKAEALLGESADSSPALAVVYALSGRENIARGMLDQLKKDHASPYHIAAVYACLGEKDRAFEWLQKAYQERDAQLIELKIEPEFDSLHSDPRFAEMIKQLGIPSKNAQ